MSVVDGEYQDWKGDLVTFFFFFKYADCSRDDCTGVQSRHSTRSGKRTSGLRIHRDLRSRPRGWWNEHPKRWTRTLRRGSWVSILCLGTIRQSHLLVPEVGSHRECAEKMRTCELVRSVIVSHAWRRQRLGKKQAKRQP